MNDIIVSIIIPTYNRSNLIGETLMSIQQQSYQNWECIVIDDGSTDNTEETVRKFIQEDSRFLYFNRPDERPGGGNGARNYGYLMSNGKYIKWLDSDDLLGEYLLEKEIETIEKHNADLVFSSWINFDSQQSPYNERNKLINTNAESSYELLNAMGRFGDYNYPSCYLVRKKTITLSGLWNENLTINQDGEFFFRVLSNTKKIKAVQYLGTFHRVDSENKISQKNDDESLLRRINSWKLIEAYTLINNEKNLHEYIFGNKNVLYNWLKIDKLDFIFTNKIFFSDNIEHERSRKIKLKIKYYKILNKLGIKF